MTIPFLAVLLSILDGSDMHIYINQMSRLQETVSSIQCSTCGRGVHYSSIGTRDSGHSTESSHLRSQPYPRTLYAHATLSVATDSGSINVEDD
ncbi:hypothetical protein BJ912DRAFT_130420 [Pholiota molesta]|nr:hypothetical protein BJ912DRAFT_130420 [Pholiota molesta]